MVIRATRGGGSFPSLIGGGGPPFMEATGGSISTSGDYKVHTFNSGGSFVVQSLGTDGTYGKAINIVAIGHEDRDWETTKLPPELNMCTL